MWNFIDLFARNTLWTRILTQIIPESWDLFIVCLEVVWNNDQFQSQKLLILGLLLGKLSRLGWPTYLNAETIEFNSLVLLLEKAMLMMMMMITSF